MTELQKIRFILFAQTGCIEKAKEALDFVLGEDKPTVRTQEEFRNLTTPQPIYADGVYIIYKDGKRELFNGNNSKENVKCVGVCFGGHKFGVSLKHIADVELPHEKKVETKRSFKGDLVALEDFDGVAGTMSLLRRGNFSFTLQNGEYIPSFGELAIMFKAKDMLNKALEYVGGDIIPDDWHWSSTEYSATYSWYINFSSGGLYINNKNNSNSVRAVCAF